MPGVMKHGFLKLPRQHLLRESAAGNRPAYRSRSGFPNQPGPDPSYGGLKRERRLAAITVILAAALVTFPAMLEITTL